jgi:transposase
MRPYSKDLRSRVLAAVDRGTSREEAARTFSVSVPTIKRWLKRRRETGGIAVSASTVGREIARLPGGWPLKKSPR